MSDAPAAGVPRPRWRTYLRLGRVSNLPTIWTNVLAGAALAGAAPRPATALLLCLAVSLLYTAGMFLNDAFDREVDARERPERPIPAGEITAAEVFLAGFAMLGGGWLLLAGAARAHGSAAAPAVAALLAGAIVVYNLWHKGNPLGPVLMGLCRALVYAAAALAVVPGLAARVVWGAAALLAYVVGLTFAAKQESRGRVRNLWPLLLIAAPLAYAAVVAQWSATVVVLFAALTAWIALSVSALRGPAPDLGRGVVRLIAGIALVDALFVAAAGFALLAWVAALGLPLTLALQRYVRGT
ncbi:MAG: UbiA family prenyltransferase [Gemmatimonadetes bacterium]|nr:UbiA family prenyltransferase [Gemmatimonadota bacterium]